jgi:hypothetical protein
MFPQSLFPLVTVHLSECGTRARHHAVRLV